MIVILFRIILTLSGKLSKHDVSKHNKTKECWII